MLWVLSVVVVASPYVFAAAGLGLFLFDFPNLLTLIFGFCFVSIGWMLRPRRQKMPPGALDLDSLPETFALLDQIAGQMAAPRVSKLVLTNEFNAFAAQIGKDNLIGIGSLLWLASDRQQRIALLAHEMGHLVNQDARRGALPAQALDTLDGWLHLVAPDFYQDTNTGVIERESHGLIGDFLLGSLRMAIELVMLAVLKLYFASLQQDEYKADALAAQVAGVGAKTALLDLMVRIEASAPLRSGILPRRDETGCGFLSRIAETPNRMPEDAVARAMNLHREEKMSLDATHPPTVYRKAFVDGLPNELLKNPLQFLQWEAVEAELHEHFEKIGQSEMQEYKVQ